MKFTAGIRYQLLHVWLFLLRAGQGTAKSLMPGLLSDPELQTLFEEVVPNALDPAYKFDTLSGNVGVTIGDSLHEAGLVDRQGTKLKTPIWGYGKDLSTISWPGLTFEVRKDQPLTITWSNTVRNPFLLTGVGRFDNQSVIDSTLHWAYGLHSCNIGNASRYCGGLSSLEKYGVPMVPHLHGGHTEFGSDGNPEFFFSRGGTLRGPRFVRSTYVYENKQPAGALWYHDHALGITRLNVYSGLVGFYFIRDDFDTGRMDNPLNLPAYPYEAALAIQDRMFKSNGELFFPAFEGDPGYADFIDKDIQEKLPNDHGPSVLTEFFGDHLVVNGKIWPRMAVEPRMYRLRLLNACDSRFLLLQFVVGDMGMLEIPSSPERVPFTIIGSDQGLAERVDWTVIGNGTSDFLVFEPGSRFDILIDFSGLANRRVIMRNVAADSPFNGEIEGDYFDNRRTDRIMALDVVNLLQPPLIMPAGPVVNPLLLANTSVPLQFALPGAGDPVNSLPKALGPPPPPPIPPGEGLVNALPKTFGPPHDPPLPDTGLVNPLPKTLGPPPLPPMPPGAGVENALPKTLGPPHEHPLPDAGLMIPLPKALGPPPLPPIPPGVGLANALPKTFGLPQDPPLPAAGLVNPLPKTLGPPHEPPLPDADPAHRLPNTMGPSPPPIIHQIGPLQQPLGPLQPPVSMPAGPAVNPLLPASTLISAPDPVALEFQAYAANLGTTILDEPRRVALFEGQDKYGRLQPLMGPVTASKVQWPTDQVYVDAHLQGGIEGSVSWRGRTPENPVCNTIETWEIWNPTADAHPIHLHLVYFQTLERFNIIWDSNTDDEGKLDENRAPQGDGTYLAAQDLVEHGSQAGDPSTLGHGWRLVNATRDTVPVQELVGHHFTGGRRDMVVALPGQVTTIRMKFDKPGRFVWHCHILSHEDHNMMHVIEVQKGTCV